MCSARNVGGPPTHFSACHAAYSRRAASSPPPALSPLIVVLAALPLIVVLAAAPARKCVVVRSVTARDAYIGRDPAHREAALWLVVQRHDKLCAIVSLADQRLVPADERRSRQCGRRDAI